MEMHKDLPVLTFGDQKECLDWLKKHHAQKDGVWFKFGKKASDLVTVTYAEAREAAIMYGWIDGLKNAYDEDSYVLRFTARRPKSKWSKINRGIAEGLIKSGKMKPSGQKEVDAAKKDGRWKAAYASQSQMPVPKDFQTALNKKPKAKKFFATVSSANRYAILYRLHDAKKPETRQKRIQQFVEMLDKGEVLYPKR